MSKSVPHPSPLPGASRVRYVVLMFAAALSMIIYLDRACLASAGTWVVKELNLHSVADLQPVFTAFILAYALFEVPSGWMGDVFGPRTTLIRIVIWWSVFIAITGLVGLKVGGIVLGGIGTMVVVQFLFGIGEAGAYPNITRSLHNWFPVQERGFTQGTVWTAGRLMGGLTPLVWALLVAGLPRFGVPELLTWRQAFWLFGLVGICWVVAFALWFRDRPEQKPGVNAAELEWIRSNASEAQSSEKHVPWGKIVRSRNLWFLCAMYACQAYGWYFCITYLPGFLEEQYGVARNSATGALYKGAPLWLGAVGCLIGGVLTDRFVRHTGNRRWGRRLFGVTGHGLAAVCFLIAPHVTGAFWVALVLALAMFFCDLTMGAAWATTQDIGRRYAAIVAGCMNMIGNLGGAIATWVSGWVLHRALEAHSAVIGVPVAAMTAAQKAAGLLPGYHANFLIFAVAFGIGMLCWTQIDATRPVAEDEKR